MIGRGGETIRSLQDRTKTRIKVQPDPRDGSDRRVTISGHKEAVAMAKKLIEDIVSAVSLSKGGYKGDPLFKGIHFIKHSINESPKGGLKRGFYFQRGSRRVHWGSWRGSQLGVQGGDHC